MKLTKKIAAFQTEQKLAHIVSELKGKFSETNSGYIVEHSKDFLILQQTDDFQLEGFKILPIDQIKKIRYNKFDKYVDQIMDWEKMKEGIKSPGTIDLTSWSSIFKTFMESGENIIIECEGDKLFAFNIGPVVQVKKNSVSIQHFGATGLFDELPTKIKFGKITSVIFADRYIDVFSKYTRKRA